MPALNKNYLICAHGISKMGNALHDVIFVLIVINCLQDNAFMMAVVFTIKFIPYFFFGSLGGIQADKLNKKTIMLTSDAIRFFLVMMMVTLVFMDYVNALVLSILAFLLTTCRCFYQPAQQSIIPNIVAKNDLPYMNSQCQIAEELGSVIGPIVAGIMVAIGSYWEGLLVDAIAYAVSIGLVANIKYHYQPQIRYAKSNKRQRFNVFSYLLKNPLLFSVVYCSAACICCTEVSHTFVSN